MKRLCVHIPRLYAGAMIAAAAGLLLPACSSMVEVGRFTPAPVVCSEPPQYCFDGSPPIAGATPFIDGGRDLSIPTTPDLRARYKARGIVWQGEGCLGGCNGYCEKGPHVAFGGHCLTPPTPGTVEYNNLIYGVGVTNWLCPNAASR